MNASRKREAVKRISNKDCVLQEKKGKISKHEDSNEIN